MSGDQLTIGDFSTDELLQELAERYVYFKELYEYEDEDLIEELEHRSYIVREERDYIDGLPIIEQLRVIGDNRRIGKPYQDNLDNLLKDVLGRAF